MSIEAKRILKFILLELSGMTHGYRSVVESCYATAIDNYGYTMPSESKDTVINKALEILNT